MTKNNLLCAVIISIVLLCRTSAIYLDGFGIVLSNLYHVINSKRTIIALQYLPLLNQ